MNSKTFNLGITMAGAVSAGAYTAGFMDYLIEVLNNWEEQKISIRKKLKDNKPLTEFEKKIPLHDVSIEALGGASAGGMVSMITALSFYKSFKPVDIPTDQKTGNFLYDSWVLLNDDIAKNITTFEKMLSTDDFDNNPEGIPSLLNSKSIDSIADKVFEFFEENSSGEIMPSYISKDLRILLTLCSLRGIPFELNFKNFSSANFPHTPGHRMNEHMIVAHFKVDHNNKTDQNFYLNFDPFSQESRDLLKLCTKATGAFPLGLAARNFEGVLSPEYVKNCILRNLEIDNKKGIDIKINDPSFDFTCIDGGTINNEPYSEVVQVLESKRPEGDPKKPMSGVIMVDPFPNFYNQDEPGEVENPITSSLFQNNIWKVIPKAYTTFREQVRVKHAGSFYKDYLRLLIFPVKWEQIGVLKDHPPISCASLGGFGGFLNREFRKHDFFLGRDNARNFLRAYCMLEYEPENPHPLFQDIDQSSVEIFGKRTEGKTFLPIIPDINFIEDKANGQSNPFKYTVEDFPKIDNSYFDKIKPALSRRVKKMLTHEINKYFENKWLFRNASKVFRGLITKRITSYVIKTMKKDFQNRKMLD
ncbi:hypothetical protein [Autumnicola musiva]|uniref:PNPLA domain-containing protein n=1 Tax=Autumnicola musiva TaxID=3075589 RepID=A0ABU3D7A4_9FLAO|nr:hypothetical protein [Zunongwangia sp. F117]MDT0677316.1 hypothetical protein [Zunongwangia sp. F117]